MEFFEPPPPRDEPIPAQPEWARPGVESLGALVPWRLVLAENARVRVLLARAIAHATGVELTVEIRFAETPDHRVFHRMSHARNPLHDDFLRFGVELSDGRKLTNVYERPDDAILMRTSGGGGDKTFTWNYWLWPLPPAGTLTFVCEWPGFDIELTRTGVDAQEALDAARRARLLWTDA
jgi:hypothetical protein